MKDLVYGVGVNDRKYPAWLRAKALREYDTWTNLLERCYCPKYQKKRPSYVGCYVSENFKSYSYFYEWCQDQVGFNQKDFQLDKDLIFKGNKLYSENTCLFLPRQLNALLTSSKRARGNLPVGVSAEQGRFRARCYRGDLPQNIGRFSTSDEAFNAYKQAKEAFIRVQAEHWRHSIDLRAYEALMRYEVAITD